MLTKIPRIDFSFGDLDLVASATLLIYGAVETVLEMALPAPTEQPIIDVTPQRAPPAVLLAARLRDNGERDSF